MRLHRSGIAHGLAASVGGDDSHPGATVRVPGDEPTIDRSGSPRPRIEALASPTVAGMPLGSSLHRDVDEGLSTDPPRPPDQHPGELQPTRGNGPGLRPKPARRRRNLTSCLLCRSRKVKCDNARPSCGYCRLHGADCTYQDAPIDPAQLGLGLRLQALQNPTGGPHTDVPNSVLLARLDHVAALLEDIRSSGLAPAAALTNLPLAQQQQQQQQQQQARGLESSAEENVHVPQTQNSIDEGGFSAASAFTDDGFGKLEIPEAAARTSACESLLQWPALRRRRLLPRVTSFALQSVAAAAEEAPHRRQLPLEHDGAVWPLCQRFLALIHVKNPVLDVVKFKRYAREAAEYGPAWDGPGCLVVRSPPIRCLFLCPWLPNYLGKTLRGNTKRSNRTCSSSHARWPA